MPINLLSLSFQNNLKIKNDKINAEIILRLLSAFVDSLHKSVVQHEVDPPDPKMLADVAVHDV
jgi:hypothetical protein